MESLGLFYGLSFLTAIIAFACALYLYLWVKKERVQNARIDEISKLIKQGADTFMTREYRILATFALVVAVIVFILLPQPVWKGSVLTNLSMRTDAPLRLPPRASSQHSSSASGAEPSWAFSS